MILLLISHYAIEAGKGIDAVPESDIGVGIIILLPSMV